MARFPGVDASRGGNPRREPASLYQRGPRPLRAGERLPLLDILRGVAVLGVLVSYTLWSLGSPPPDQWTGLDRLIVAVAANLVDLKFLTIFAFLFGLGSAQQWRRVDSQGRDPIGIHVKRMLFLLTVGVLHGALLRNGDILAPYAVLGFALAAARRVPSGWLAVAALALALAPNAVQATMHWTGWSLADRPGPTGGNLDWLRYWYLTNPFLSWPRILALMLVGVVAERARLVERLTWDGRFTRRMLAVGVVAAITLRVLLFFFAERWSAVDRTLPSAILLDQLRHLSAWSLAGCYVAGLAVVCRRPARADRLWWLQATGRMAFTNYVMQAALVVPLCLLFGWFDQVTPTLGLTLAVGVAAFQIPFSIWWQHRVIYGPLEWLWRAVTYGSARPLGSLVALRSPPRIRRAAAS